MREKILEILRHPSLDLKSRPSGLDDPAAKVADQFLAFLSEWNQWSPKIDLTSEGDAQTVLEKHVFDSLQYARAIPENDPAVLDIGSGAGFPAIPLKIVRPGFRMVLVESRRKRANFLKSVARSLALRDLEVVHARAEELAREKNYPNRFDYVTFKSVAPLAECLSLALPFLKPGGRIIIKKEAETDISPESAGLRLKEEIPIQSFYGIPSKLMVFEKCSTWNI